MRVLIAEDDPVSRMLLQTTVERHGHRCDVAADGDTAWRLLDEHRPDVLITDRMMPGVDGLELCRRTRAQEDRPYTYIILVTSLAEQHDVLQGMEAGADDYLTKPIDAFALRTRLIAARRVTDLHARLGASQAKLEALARTDPLTGLRNRLSLGDDLQAIHAHAVRYGRSYAVAMCDVDLFKRYNDTAGHQAGDDVLREVGSALAACAREADGVYRYGGEEFLLLLPEQTLESAVEAAERVRAAVEALGIPHPGKPEGEDVTVSVGLASLTGPDQPADEVLHEADQALYRAKEAGRNRVVLSVSLATVT